MPLSEAIAREQLRKNLGKRVAEIYTHGKEKPTSWGRRIPETPEQNLLSEAITDMLMETELRNADAFSPKELEKLKTGLVSSLISYRAANPGVDIKEAIRAGGVVTNIPPLKQQARTEAPDMARFSDIGSDAELETIEPQSPTTHLNTLLDEEMRDGSPIDLMPKPAAKPKPTAADILRDLDSDAEHSAPSTPTTLSASPLTPAAASSPVAAPIVPAKTFIEALQEDITKEVLKLSGETRISPENRGTKRYADNISYFIEELKAEHETSAETGFSLEQRLTEKGRETLVKELGSAAYRSDEATESPNGERKYTPYTAYTELMGDSFDNTKGSMDADRTLLMSQEEVVRKTISKRVAEATIPEEGVAGAAKSVFGKLFKKVTGTETAISERDTKIAELSAAIQERLIQDVGIPVLSKLSKEETEALKAEVTSAIEGYKKAFPTNDVATAVKGRGTGKEVDPLKYITDQESTIGRKQAALAAEAAAAEQVATQKMEKAEAVKPPTIDAISEARAKNDAMKIDIQITKLHEVIHTEDVKTINANNTLEKISAPVAEMLVNGKNASFLKKIWNEDKTNAASEHLCNVLVETLKEDKSLVGRVANLTPKEIESLSNNLHEALEKYPGLKADIANPKLDDKSKEALKVELTPLFKEALDKTKAVSVQKDQDLTQAPQVPDTHKERAKVEEKMKEWQKVASEASKKKISNNGLLNVFSKSVAEEFTHGKDANFLTKAMNSNQVEIRANTLKNLILGIEDHDILTSMAALKPEQLEKVQAKLTESLKARQKESPGQSAFTGLKEVFPDMLKEALDTVAEKKEKAPPKLTPALQKLVDNRVQTITLTDEMINGTAAFPATPAKKLEADAPLLQTPVPKMERSTSSPSLSDEPGTALTPPSSMVRFEEGPPTRSSSPLQRVGSLDLDGFVMVEMPEATSKEASKPSAGVIKPELKEAVHDVQEKMHELATKGPDKKTIEVAKAASHVSEAAKHTAAEVGH